MDFRESDEEAFMSCDSFSSILEESAEKYEKIFEEIQNFEIADEALDKIEEVFDENLKLKQTNNEMKKQLEELQASIDVHNFKSINESLKKRQSGNILLLGELKPNPPLVAPKVPPPPPPPPIPTPYTSKYRSVFWTKIQCPTSTIFENIPNFQLKQSSLNKFLFTSKCLKPENPTPSLTKRILDHSREITLASVLRILAYSPDQLLTKISNCSADLCEDIDKIRALYRILPSESEVSQLTLALNSGAKLSQNEELLYGLSRIPNIQSLVDCIYYKLTFPNVCEEISVCFANWANAANKLMANKRLRDFFGLVLAFGNELNSGHPRYGDAKGFKLSFLDEIVNVKSSDSSALLDVLVEDYCQIHGNPHIFHHSEYILLKEIASSSFTSLLETYEKFYQEYCKLSSVQLTENCEKYIRTFVNAKRKTVERVIELMNEAKNNIGTCHQYFAETEEFDDEGRVKIFCLLARFYDKYLESIRKKWVGVSNRDSRRFTMVSENKRKSRCPRSFK